MKLWIISDLHRDHDRSPLQPPADAEVAVIAGDVCDDDWLAELAACIPVVFVAGNHEFYGHGYHKRLAELAALPGVTFLNDGMAIIGGVRFIGATLWTDYNGGDPVAMYTASRSMNDHRLIKWRKEPWMRFRPQEAAALHKASRAYIAEQLALPFDGKTVVVTHHAPSTRSVHERYAGDVLNWAYVSDMDDVVASSGAALWVHGHVHSAWDYTIGGTRVIANPHGYPHEVGRNGFYPGLVVTV